MVPIYVWRKPIYVRTLFYIQLIFSCSVYVSHHFLVIPNRKYGHTCMARDWVATAYVWIFYYFLFTYFACLYEYWRNLLLVWKALYVSGHTINDQIHRVTRRNCFRTCLVTFQLTRHVWLRNTNAFIRVWTSLLTDQMHIMVTRRKCVRTCLVFFSTDQTRMVTWRNFWPEWESRLIVSTYSRFAHDWIDLRTRKKGPCSIHV